MAHLIDNLQRTHPENEYDKDRSTIRCLAHVIHLAVMELLVEVKVVKKSGIRTGEIEQAVDMDTEAAESIAAEDGLGDMTDDDLLNMQEGEKDVDISAVVQKVSFVAIPGLLNTNVHFHRYDV